MEKIELSQPEWIDLFLSEYPAAEFCDSIAQMELAVSLSAENIKQETGGPFAAVIFDSAGKVVAAAVNTVVSANNSVLHAETSVIMQAQTKFDTFDLSPLKLTLVSSSQPCVMCFGAIMWSGIKYLKYGALKQDVEEVGKFDEGPAIDQKAEFLKRGVECEGPVLREKAVKVLSDYVASGSVIYNPNNKRES